MNYAFFSSISFNLKSLILFYHSLFRIGCSKSQINLPSELGSRSMTSLNKESRYERRDPILKSVHFSTHIKAMTPQAKGRVERLFQKLQDRWIVELRLRGIDSLETADQVLPELVKAHNEQFAVLPRDSESAFVPPGTRAVFGAYSLLS